MRHLKLLVLCTLAFTLVECSSSNRSKPLNPPYGVAFGGLFVLEDWFYSNKNLAAHVATPCWQAVGETTQFTTDTSGPNFQFSSETDLVRRLLQSNVSAKTIIEYFKKHRSQFFLPPGSTVPSGQDAFEYMLDENMKSIQALGIKAIRLPVTWALTYPNLSTTIQTTVNPNPTNPKREQN
jgi:hypothetical protein